MNAKFINIGSNLSKVDAHAIQPEEYDELPELDDAFFERADLYKGDKLIRAGRPKPTRFSPDCLQRTGGRLKPLSR